MKKLLYSLSIALVAGVAANAAAPKTSLQKMKLSSFDANAQVEQMIAPGAMKATPNQPKKVKRDAPATAEDFVGTYTWAGDNCLSGEVWPNEGMMSITLDAENPGKLIIDGLPYSDLPLSGCYVQDGKLYIPNQYWIENTYYGQEVWFWNYSFQNTTREGEPAYTYVRNDDYQFCFTMFEDGSLMAGSILDADKFNNHQYTDSELLSLTCIGGAMMPADQSGWFWLCRFIDAYPLEMFTFNEAEWKYMGEALFKDPWFCIFWQDNDSPQYYVPFYCNVVEPNRYLLKDPYGPNTPYTEEFTENDGSKFTINISNEPGYLVFSVEEPECVTFEPLVYAMTFDGSVVGDDGYAYPTDCFNFEGYNYYLNGATYEDIMVYCMQNDMMTSFFDPTDPEGPFLQIYNTLFAFNFDPTYPYSWSGVEADGWILFPNDYDSVEDILGEENNAPAEYFNLQGVRLNNPEKGQLVIVRKGNKASKMIVR